LNTHDNNTKRSTKHDDNKGKIDLEVGDETFSEIKILDAVIDQNNATSNSTTTKQQQQ